MCLSAICYKLKLLSCCVLVPVSATRVQHETIKANETCQTKEGLKGLERLFFRSNVEQNVSYPVVPLKWTSAIG